MDYEEVRHIFEDEEYQEFRDKCLEISLLAKKLNIPRSVVYCGVAIDFEFAFKTRLFKPFE